MSTSTEPEPLTAKQTVVLAYLCRHLDEFGYPPTVREVMKAMGIASPNGVLCHLKSIERKGWIARSAGSARAITVLHRPEETT